MTAEQTTALVKTYYEVDRRDMNQNYTVHNILNEDFVCKWDNVEYSVEAGGVFMNRLEIAKHMATKIAYIWLRENTPGGVATAMIPSVWVTKIEEILKPVIYRANEDGSYSIQEKNTQETPKEESKKVEEDFGDINQGFKEQNNMESQSFEQLDSLEKKVLLDMLPKNTSFTTKNTKKQIIQAILDN